MGGAMFINILLWVAIGIVGGLIAYYIYPTKKEVLPGMVMAGIVGAFTGGVFYSIIRIGTLAAAIDPLASLMAVISAILILNLVHKSLPVDEDFLTQKEYHE